MYKEMLISYINKKQKTHDKLSWVFICGERGIRTSSCMPIFIGTFALFHSEVTE
jgi:hypothetical protein